MTQVARRLGKRTMSLTLDTSQLLMSSLKPFWPSKSLQRHQISFFETPRDQDGYMGERRRPAHVGNVARVPIAYASVPRRRHGTVAEPKPHRLSQRVVRERGRLGFHRLRLRPRGRHDRLRDRIGAACSDATARPEVRWGLIAGRAALTLVRANRRPLAAHTPLRPHLDNYESYDLSRARAPRRGVTWV